MIGAPYRFLLINGERRRRIEKLKCGDVWWGGEEGRYARFEGL